MKIEVSINRPPNIDQLIMLFHQAGWVDKTDKERIVLMIENSTIVVTAWDRKKMIGFARCLTDYAFNGLINTVVVDKEYRGLGIGKQIINKILNTSDQVTYVLRADPDNIDFYKKLGFENDKLAVVFKRKG